MYEKHGCGRSISTLFFSLYPKRYPIEHGRRLETMISEGDNSNVSYLLRTFRTSKYLDPNIDQNIDPNNKRSFLLNKETIYTLTCAPITLATPSPSSQISFLPSLLRIKLAAYNSHCIEISQELAHYLLAGGSNAALFNHHRSYSGLRCEQNLTLTT